MCQSPRNPVMLRRSKSIHPPPLLTKTLCLYRKEVVQSTVWNWIQRQWWQSKALMLFCKQKFKQPSETSQKQLEQKIVSASGALKRLRRLWLMTKWAQDIALVTTAKQRINALLDKCYNAFLESYMHWSFDFICNDFIIFSVANDLIVCTVCMETIWIATNIFFH